MIEKMKSLPKQLETIQENQSKFSKNHQTMLTTAKNINQMNQDINQMNQDTIDANQQMKTALDFLSIAYKEIIDKNEKLDDEIQNLEKVPETTKNQVKEMTDVLESFKKQNKTSSLEGINPMTTVADNDTDQIAIHQLSMNNICNKLQLRQQKQRNLVIFGLE